MIEPNDMTGISIVIPLYNKQTTITSTIESLIDLPDKCKKEIIIVDDGSTDKSLELAKGFLPNVKIIEQKNKGPSAARNSGANLASYPYLVFLDADDELKPGFLDEHILMRENESQASITFVSFQIIHHDSGETQDVDITNKLRTTGRYFRFSGFDFNFISFIHSGCFCINKTIFQRVGGYDELLRLMEVTDLLSRLFVENPVSVVSQSVLSVKNEANSESQFQRAAKDPEQFFRFGKKLIDLIDHVSQEQKWLLSKELVFTINKLWASKEYRKISKLLISYRPLRLKYALAKPSIKIIAVSLLLSPFR